MNRNRFYSTLFFIAFVVFSTAFAKAQTGANNVKQDNRIPELLELKSALSKEGELNDRYKIQLYSGSRTTAEGILKSYRTKIGVHKSLITYETPNYKIWVGNYRNRLEADRALLKIKKEFPSAFIFKPERG